jgi:hypothetical protein
MTVDPIILQIQAETRKIKQDLDNLDKKVDQTQKSFDQAGKSGKKAFDDTGKSSDKAKRSINQQDKSVDRLERGYKRLESRIIAAFAIDRLARFTGEAIKLAGEVQGVEAAFGRISRPGLLRELQDATRNTVSDLELMKQAVRANNFQIPLDQLASLFDFARRRAKETGEEVDFLVNSIIAGIGRKSPLILDNLGISAVRLRKELKGVGVQSADIGEIAKVVGDIATEEMEKMGEETVTTKDRIDALNASFENMQAEIGAALIPAVEDLMGALEGLSNRFDYIAAAGLDAFAGGFYTPEQIEGLKVVNRSIDDLIVETGKLLNSVSDDGIEGAWEQVRQKVQENIVETKEFKRLSEQLKQRVLERADGELSAIRFKREQKVITEEEIKLQQQLNKTTQERVGIIKGLKDDIKALNEELPDAQSQGEINRILDARNAKEIQLNAILNQRKNLLDFENDDTDPTIDLPTFPEDPFGIGATLPESLQKAEEDFETFYDNLLMQRAENAQSEADWAQFVTDQQTQAFQTRLALANDFFSALISLQRTSGKNAKELATFQAFLNFFLAVSDALAQPLDPITKAIYVASITAQSAAQIASIQAQEPPSFFKGTPFFSDSPSKGRKKDDGWARLHYGEAVIPSEANKRSKGLSEAWINGKEDAWIYTNHILPAIVQDRTDRKDQRDRSFAQNIARSMSLNMPDDRMVKELKRNRFVSELMLDEIKKKQRKNPYRA